MKTACMLVIGVLVGLTAGVYMDVTTRTLTLLLGLAFIAVLVWTMDSQTGKGDER